MGNSVFRFKKFTVNQDSVGMKITADACLFATLIDVQETSSILDIGSGTGLLSLMLAQRNVNAHLLALEIDDHAYNLTVENFENSPWNERLSAIQIDFRTYASNKRFDLIICNPPFFKNQSKSNNEKRRLAFHQDTYSLEAYFAFCEEKLTSNGLLYLLYPTDQMEQVKKAAKEQDFHLAEVTFFKGKKDKESHCACLKLTREEVRDLKKNELICRKDDNSYSDAYIQLLKPFQIIF